MRLCTVLVVLVHVVDPYSRTIVQGLPERASAPSIRALSRVFSLAVFYVSCAPELSLWVVCRSDVCQTIVPVDSTFIAIPVDLLV